MPTPVKIPAKIEKIVQYTRDVKSFIMKPLKTCPVFKPGQFLHLAIDEYDPSFHWPESRVFSIANSPTRNENIRIVFAVKGIFTKRMFDEITEGNKVWLKLPYGNFTFPENDSELVLIAGGTGITPFISYLEYALDKRSKNKIYLWYGVRSPEYIIFRNLLNQCQLILRNFHFRLFIENNIIKYNFDNVYKGPLSIENILHNNSPNAQWLYYISGPPQMIKSFKEIMLNRGIKEENIRIDEWE